MMDALPAQEAQLAPQYTAAERLARVTAKLAPDMGMTAPSDEFWYALVTHNDQQDSEIFEPHLTPDNFLLMLNASLNDLDLFDTPHLNNAIKNFAEHADAEFIEPQTDEADWPSTANRYELSISSFIENAEQLGPIELMRERDTQLILEIYNHNNLLSFAQELADTSTDGLSEESLEMIYRYRTVVQRLYGIALAHANEKVKEPKVGARTWAGDLHPYGHHLKGRIIESEYRDFSALPEDPEAHTIVVEGVQLTTYKLKRLAQ